MQKLERLDYWEMFMTDFPHIKDLVEFNLSVLFQMRYFLGKLQKVVRSNDKKILYAAPFLKYPNKLMA